MVIMMDIKVVECWLWAEYLGEQSNFLLRDLASILKEIMGANFLNPENTHTSHLDNATSAEWTEAIEYANYFLNSSNSYLAEIGQFLIEWRSG